MQSFEPSPKDAGAAASATPDIFVAAYHLWTHGGIQTYVRAFVEALRREYQVDVLTRDPHPSEVGRRTRSLQKPLALGEQGLAAARFGRGLVIADQVQTAAALVIARAAHRACFVYAAEVTGGRGRTLKAKVLKQQERIWGITEWVRGYVIDHFALDPAAVRVIKPPVDCERFRPATDQQKAVIRARLGLPANDRPVVLCVGRLDPVSAYKGIDLTIEAMAHLPDLAPVCVVVGSGPDLPRLRRVASARDVHFVGSVSAEHLPDYFAAADVFSMPSHAKPFGSGVRTEGFGIVYLEAAASGVPSIRGTAPGTAEAVVEGLTGSASDADAAHVAQSLRRWLEGDEKKKRSTSIACREWALEHSVDHFAASVLREVAELA